MADDKQFDLGPFKGDRPFKFTDPVDLRRRIQNYFDACDPHQEKRVVESGVNQRGETIFTERQVMRAQRPYTTSGLARALGTSRQSLLEYQTASHCTDEIPEDVRQESIDAIGDAKRRVDEFAETQLFEGNANGAKFNLTNNHGWVEKTVQVPSTYGGCADDWRARGARASCLGRLVCCARAVPQLRF